MAHLAIRLLGAFQASIEGRPIQKFESMKVRALLAYLAVERSQPQSREHLMALFWPEMPPKRASSNLSQALYNLTRRLQNGDAEQPYLLRTHESVQFNPKSDFWLDVAAFKQQFDQASKDGDKAALSEALQLYQGDFLAGFIFDGSPTFDEWLLIERHRLQRRALLGLGKLAQRYAQDGDLDAALRYAWRQVDLDPLNEPATRQLMRLLEGSGQRSQALAQFERLQVLLSEELDIRPEQETIALRDQIRGQAPDAVIRARRRDNLPAFLTSLVGRQRELAEVQEQLSSPDCRLLTILGPGGSGKSRLALEVARSMEDSFPQGLVFVPLNPVQSVDSILGAVLEALELTPIEQEDPTVQLVNYLREKQILLVLDGFEHLLAGSALVLRLLQEAGGFKLLVTSRMRLNLKGEYLYLLEGMDYPGEGASLAEIQDSDAVQLLIHTLRHVDPGYQPDASDLVHLHRICQQVLGMPLGILLAASWGGTLAVEEIAGMVGKSLDLMAASWDDLPARQRSLRATFDYTWNLLSERQQVIFQSVSVFRGPFTRQAARSVSGATPYELRDLVDRSLLWKTTPGWFELHELLRQYGRQVLSNVPEIEHQVCSLHSAYYLGQLADLAPDLKDGGQIAALAKIDLDHENYRAAWRWAARIGEWGQIEGALEPFCLYYDLKLRFQEGERTCLEALDRLQLQEGRPGFLLLRSHLLIWGSRFTRLKGNPDQAFQQRKFCQSLLERAGELGLDSRYGQALLHYETADSLMNIDLIKARENYQLGMQIFRDLDQTWWEHRAVLGKIGSDTQNGDYHSARSSLQVHLPRLELDGDRRHLAKALNLSGFIHIRQGEIDQAMHRMQQSAQVYDSIGDRTATAESLSGLGLMLGWHGRYQESLKILQQCLACYHELGGDHHTAFYHLVIGINHACQGYYTKAVESATISLSQARRFELWRIAGGSLLVLGWVELVRSNFNQASQLLSESVEQYRRVNHQDELGWALAALGQAELAQGNNAAGLSRICESLEIGRRIEAAMTISQALGPVALWTAGSGNLEQAVERYSLALRQPLLTNARWFADIYGHRIEALTVSLPDDILAAARERGSKMDLWRTGQDVLAELNQAQGEMIQEITFD